MIIAIILQGDFKSDQADYFDLYPIPLTNTLTLFHIDFYYSACWQHQLRMKGNLPVVNITEVFYPKEIVIAEIIKRTSLSSNPRYAIIMTEYFAGMGDQYANVFINDKNGDEQVSTINQALKFLGVVAVPGNDEFDTIEDLEEQEQQDIILQSFDLNSAYGPAVGITCLE
jgi:predicted MPP superfamily phosphohydrolase